MASVRKREWTHNGETKSAWVCEYTDDKGKRRRKTFEKKKDADRYRTQVEGEIARGEHVAPTSETTVSAICERFLRHLDQRVKDGTMSKSRRYIYSMAVDRAIVPLLGVVQYADLTSADFERWWSDLASVYPGQRTRYDMLACFVQVEKFAIRRGVVKRPTAASFSRDLPRKESDPIKVLDAEKVGKILKAAEERQPGKQRRTHMIMQCAVHLAAFCGLRFGEIMGLTVSSLDLDRRLISVRHNLTVHGELKGPKTAAGRRDVPMPSHVVEMLKRWMADFYIENDRRLVFRTEGGGDMACTNFHKFCWKPLLKRAGLWADDGDQFHFHALRHFAASFMIHNGLPVTDVAALLGHRKFDTTLQIYAHPITPGHRRTETVDRMAQALLLPG